MSRFFAGSDSESESSSSEEDVMPTRSAPTRAVAWSDSDDEDAKRVVKSEKEKRFDELADIIKQSRNYRKIKDMSNTLSAFENLTKAFEKAKRVIDKEGLPHFFIRHLAELEDFTAEYWEDKEAKKAMSKNNAKGLTTLRQRLKKYNKDFEDQIKLYRENPDEYLAEDQEEETVPDATVIAAAAPVGKKEKAIKVVKEQDDSDDSIWSTSSDETSSSDDEDLENPALKFLKKAPTESKQKKVKAAPQPKPVVKAKVEEDDEGWTEVSAGARPQERPKMFQKDEDITHEAVIKKLTEIIAVRGKKGTKRTEQVLILEELRDIAQGSNLGAGLQVKIRFSIMEALLDYNPAISSCMKPDAWSQCLNAVDEMLEFLEQNPTIKLSMNIKEDEEEMASEPYKLRGCIFSTVERMDDEFTKMLQACDAHSPDYVERLKDEQRICAIIEALTTYGKSHGTADEMCRVHLLNIRHTYYKFDKPASEGDENTSIKKMKTLCCHIFINDTTDRIRTQAILYNIYHLALHNNWFKARNQMLMSHLQESVSHSDVPTQICYNRCMVQLGLCAFRKGFIRDAHDCLLEIQSSGRAKELLAQGLLLQRQNERTAEQEKIEKMRQMPYHMHINLELLECVYLVSAMLLEIPYLAAHELDSRRRLISKNFHHVLRISERQPLTGPPESMREHVVQASKAMKRGEWKSCRDYLINDKMNLKVWDLFTNADQVRDMITLKIQEETLRTYLFTYSSIYTSLSMDTLAEMFQLPRTTIHSIISKMIINEELLASLDEPTQSVVMHRTEPSRLQSTALLLSDKVASLVENNERLLEIKQGNHGFSNKGGYDKDGGQQRGNRGGAYRRVDNQNWKNRQGFGGRSGYQQKNY
ncbi:eukaryotic translation initiation factor 3 subunit C-like [Watersipora subatra]|uniref:eukaryotic translation initiation factor 3 subunit C-like n=1 Tax=Watersipora subatra TaxID=2589382 RepID=UPI00355B8B45